MEELLEKLLNEDDFDDTFKPASEEEQGKRAEDIKKELAKGAIPAYLINEVEHILTNNIYFALTKVIDEVIETYPNFSKDLIYHPQFIDVFNDNVKYYIGILTKYLENKKWPELHN